MANPTTNYGFVLPTPTDLVTDLPADFDVALQGVDTRLKALNPSTTLGDIEYRSATANTNTRLGIGSTGNVLTVSGGVPVWSAPAGGGKVLQVVGQTITTETTIASTSFVDTAITATITPTAATSKILVIISYQVRVARTTANQFYGAKLLRGATEINNYDINSFLGYASSGTHMATGSVSRYDSPNTTSATTYKLQATCSDTGSSQNIIFQYLGYPSAITLLEIGA
jgi:hypothetical protein